MADYERYNGDEDNAEIRKLTAELEVDPDNFDSWQKLVEAAASLEGGLNRNSSPQALALYRDSYDRFLHHFPLVFGYWKKYATMEFSIAGPEAAVLVYERGCASITNSVDLWTDFCRFKMETTHDPKLVRELFERAASFVGLDFLAHEFWDRYIEFENRQEAPDRVFAILTRVIHIPMHQYARYYQTFRELMVTRPLGELAAPEVLARFRTEVESDPSYPGVQRPEHDIERDVRAKIDAMYYEVFTRTQTETSKRWTFESEITRPYFHVGELEHAQLSNWRKYLDFEEGEGEHSRIVALYERCLVTCAFYDEFWFRYARWMLAQEDKKEEVRHIYQRASTVFVPISRPGIRLQWAHFEEAFGRIDVARDIHMAIMATLPNCIEAVISLAHLNRRQSGLDAAIAVFKEQIDTPTIDILTKAVLVSQWAMLLVKVKGSIDEARQVFEANVEWYADSLLFWTKWLEFELDQPNSAQDEAQHSARLKNIFDTLRTKSRLSTTVKKRLSQVYLTYLEERGGKNAMMQFLTLDRDMFGPPSVSALSQANAGSKEGATHLGELDAATRAKAESNYLPYYKLHADPVPDATGPAPFQ